MTALAAAEGAACVPKVEGIVAATRSPAVAAHGREILKRVGTPGKLAKAADTSYSLLD